MALTNYLDSNGTRYIIERVREKADINSPEFTGTPKAPTPAEGSNDKQVATTEFVKAAIEAAELSVYSIKGQLDDPADLPDPAEPGDIYEVKPETIVTDGDPKEIVKVVGVVDEYEELATIDPEPEAGSIYRVKNAGQTDPADDTTAFPENSYFEKQDDGSWNLISGTGYPENTKYMYTDNDGWIPRDNDGIDLSAYATKEEVNDRIKYEELTAIPLSDIVSWFNPTPPAPTYNAVTPVGTEDPSALGWYEKSGEEYVLSTDTAVDSTKTYYAKA